MNSKPHPTESRHASKKARFARKRVRRNLVALGSAAVLAIYAAGFLRTASAAHRLAAGARKRPGASEGASERAVATAPAALPHTTPASKAVVATSSSAAPATSPTVATAASPIAAPSSDPKDASPRYRDGVFYGWGYCRHGSLQASVAIKDGRIALATIPQCYTRYSKNVITALLPQVVTRQSPDVDWISGATESSDAFYDALVEALRQAK